MYSLKVYDAYLKVPVNGFSFIGEGATNSMLITWVQLFNINDIESIVNDSLKFQP